jgi:hypothetical protein
MLHMLEGLAGSDDIDHQIAVLHELNTTLTMASGHQGQMRLGPALPILVGLLSSPSGEVCLLAVRALNTAIDIAPRAALTISAEGALPVLCRHLLHIADIDLAEQCLKCLQLVAAEAPRPVIDAGGLKACTAYFDFFPAALQRTALNTVATLCTPGVLGRKEDVPRLLEIIPLLSSLLSGGHDSTSAALAQAASLCLERLSAAFAAPRTSSSSSSSSSSAASDRAVLLQQQQQQLRRLEGGAAAAAAEAAARSGKATQQPERWKAAFVLELGASSGVLTQWLGTLRGATLGAAAGSSGGGSSSSSSGTVDNEVLWQRQTQVLASLERMVATAPAVVASLYEKGGAAVLRDLLAEYVGRAESEAGRTEVAADVAATDEQQPLADGEARLLEILQLAAAMLPAPEDKGTGIELGRTGSAAAGDADEEENDMMDLVTFAVPEMAPPRSKQLQTEAAIAADAAVAAAMSEEWACRACTFVNSAANKLHCEMCTTLNPHARAAKAAAAAAGMHASPPLKPSPALSAALGLSSDSPPHFDLGAAAVASAAKQAPLLAGHMVAEAAQVPTLGDVYLHKPVYVRTYCETLLPLLLRLVPACSSPAVDAPVLRILSSLFALKAYPAAGGGQGEDMAATLGQLLGTGGRDVAVKVKALELGLALLSERDDDSSSSSSSSGDASLYRELFLRHGVVLQVQRSVSSASQQPVKASKSKGKGKGRSKQQQSVLELPPAVVGSSTVVHDAAYTAAAEAFLSAYEAGRSGKRQSSGETLESTALASLKQIAAALRAAAAAPPGTTAEPAAAAVVLPAVTVEQQKRGKKRARTAASSTTVVPTAVVSEESSMESSSVDAAAGAALHALAQAVLSEHGITAFELEDSGVVPALVAYMLSSLPPPSTEAEQWLAERQARAHRLQAFATAFMAPSSSSSSSAPPVLPRFIAKVQDCLRAAADGLQVVRHGGASEQARLRQGLSSGLQTA